MDRRQSRGAGARSVAIVAQVDPPAVRDGLILEEGIRVAGVNGRRRRLDVEVIVGPAIALDGLDAQSIGDLVGVVARRVSQGDFERAARGVERPQCLPGDASIGEVGWGRTLVQDE